jgi:polycystin 1L2
MISTDMSLRVFLSGCYYMIPTTGSYSTWGTEVMPDTGLNYTHCQVTHFTEFAGGFIVLPAAVNFDSVWANASIAQNPILYATVFTIIGLYVVLAVVCRIFDMRDRKKKGLTMLNENRVDNLYEIIVFTGSRKDASTDSNVHLVISGENAESHVIKMRDKSRRVFRRGGVDSFIVSSTELVFYLIII